MHNCPNILNTSARESSTFSSRIINLFRSLDTQHSNNNNKSAGLVLTFTLQHCHSSQYCKAVASFFSLVLSSAAGLVQVEREIRAPHFSQEKKRPKTFTSHANIAARIFSSFTFYISLLLPSEPSPGLALTWNHHCWISSRLVKALLTHHYCFFPFSFQNSWKSSYSEANVHKKIKETERTDES